MSELKLENSKLEEIAETLAEKLKSGGLVILPTETVYGLFCVYDSKEALKKMFDLKKRTESKVLSLTLSDVSEIAYYADVKEWQIKTAEKILPGPVTLIFKAREKLNPYLVSEEGKVGIRIPDFEFTRKVIKKTGKPLASTSANISGKASPFSYSQIEKELIKKVDASVDAGECPLKVASTVYDLSEFPGKVIRRGAFNPEIIVRTAEKFFKET